MLISAFLLEGPCALSLGERIMENHRARESRGPSSSCRWLVQEDVEALSLSPGPPRGSAYGLGEVWPCFSYELAGRHLHPATPSASRLQARPGRTEGHLLSFLVHSWDQRSATPDPERPSRGPCRAWEAHGKACMQRGRGKWGGKASSQEGKKDWGRERRESHFFTLHPIKVDSFCAARHIF